MMDNRKRARMKSAIFVVSFFVGQLGVIVVAEDAQQQQQSCSPCIDPNSRPIIAGGVADLELYHPEKISCAELVDLAVNIPPNTPECDHLHSYTWLCGCPEVPNACHLCDFQMNRPENVVALSDGTTMNCALYEAKLRNIMNSTEECIVTDAMTDACECIAEDVFVPCPICPNGEPVGNPDLDISGHVAGLVADGFLNGRSVTCGMIDLYFKFAVSSTSSLCGVSGYVSKLCGCQVRENACSICGTGTMGDPFAASIWEFGTLSDESFGLNPGADEDSLWDFEATGEFTCAVMDSSYSNNHDADDWFCFWNQLTRGPFCGCSDISKSLALIWCQRVVGIGSMVASLVILSYILLQKRPDRWSTLYQLVFGISIYDFVSSFAFALATLPVPKELGIYGAHGNKATCLLQGFMLQVGQTSMYYNLGLSIHFILLIKFGWTERKLLATVKWFHVIANMIGFGLAFTSIPFHLGDYRWCYIQTPPYAPSILPGVFLFILPVSIAILLIVISTCSLVFYVHVTEKQTFSTSMRRLNPENQSLSKRMLWQSIFYLLPFLVWPILFVSFFLRPTPSTYWFYIVAALLGPSQGIWNAVVFFRRKHKSFLETFSMKNLRALITQASQRRSNVSSNQASMGDNGITGFERNQQKESAGIEDAGFSAGDKVQVESS